MQIFNDVLVPIHCVDKFIVILGGISVIGCSFAKKEEGREGVISNAGVHIQNYFVELAELFSEAFFFGNVATAEHALCYVVGEVYPMLCHGKLLIGCGCRRSSVLLFGKDSGGR